MAGLPFSGCESGRLRKRPSGPKAFGPAEWKKGERPDLRIKDLPGRKRDFGQRDVTGGAPGFGPAILRAGPGFGPGAAKKATQGFGSWTPGGTEASAKDPILFGIAASAG
jgi:hypothetical protein